MMVSLDPINDTQAKIFMTQQLTESLLKKYVPTYSFESQTFQSEKN